MKALKQITIMMAVLAFLYPVRLHAEESVADKANDAKKNVSDWAEDKKNGIANTFGMDANRDAESWNRDDKQAVQDFAKRRLDRLNKEYIDLQKRVKDVKADTPNWNATLEERKKANDAAYDNFKKAGDQDWQSAKDQMRDSLKNYAAELEEVAKSVLPEKQAFEWQVQASLLTAEEHIDRLKKEEKQVADPEKQHVQQQIKNLEDSKGRVEEKFKKLQSTNDDSWKDIKQDIKSDLKGLGPAALI